MFLIFNTIRIRISGDMDLYKALFSAFDLNMNKTIGCKELIEVYKIIETEQEEMDSKEILNFKRNYSIYVSGGKEKKSKPMSMNSFIQFCTDFSYFRRKTIFKFLDIPSTEIEAEYFT
jgi:hypothetical protein